MPLVSASVCVLEAAPAPWPRRSRVTLSHWELCQFPSMQSAGGRAMRPQGAHSAVEEPTSGFAEPPDWPRLARRRLNIFRRSPEQTRNGPSRPPLPTRSQQIDR